MNYLDYKHCTQLINEPRKSLLYALARGGAYDNPLLRPTSSHYSPVEEGILNHVKTRLITPFQSRFSSPAAAKQYFFRPIKFGFEPNQFEKPHFESILEQICSVVLPVLRMIDPLTTIKSTLSLSSLYLVSSVIAFGQALYYFGKECINKDDRVNRKSIDHLKQCASNFLIALAMPALETVSGILDTIKLVTRLVATLFNCLKPKSSAETLRDIEKDVETVCAM